MSSPMPLMISVTTVCATRPSPSAAAFISTMPPTTGRECRGAAEWQDVERQPVATHRTGRGGAGGEADLDVPCRTFSTAHDAARHQEGRDGRRPQHFAHRVPPPD